MIDETIRGNNENEKYFIRLETDAEGIRQYKQLPESEKQGISLGQMRVEGKLVPAIKLEVDKVTYDEFQRESWKAEDRYKQENRCIICGKDGKSIRCPARVANPLYTDTNGQTKTIANDCSNCPHGYHRLFRPVKGKIYFSALDITDASGNTDEFEPDAGCRHSDADIYLALLQELIEYINIHYPQYSSYTELISLLGNEIDMKDAADIMDKPKSTLYGWLKRIRPIFDEFMDTVDFL